MIDGWRRGRFDVTGAAAVWLLGTCVLTQTWGTGTRPLSPSVAGTFVSRNGTVAGIVLWRGGPGWFSAPERSSGGGTGELVSGTSEYGGIAPGGGYCHCDPCRLS